MSLREHTAARRADPPATGGLVFDRRHRVPVTLDGKSAGVTPLTVPTSQRPHSLRIARGGYLPRNGYHHHRHPAGPHADGALARLAPPRRVATPSPSRPAAPRTTSTPRAASPLAASPPAAPVGEADTTARTAGLLVESRPAGARVTLDDGSRRYPLTLNTVGVGEHSIAIERPGYRPWAASVTVAAVPATASPPRSSNSTGPRRHLWKRYWLWKTGLFYRGSAAGAEGTTAGEVVFTPACPAIRNPHRPVLLRADRDDDVRRDRQLLGSPDDVESRKPQVAGFIIRDESPMPAIGARAARSATTSRRTASSPFRTSTHVR